jgi:NhaP-type Na+/H+ or K+/H+ antiporter
VILLCGAGTRIGVSGLRGALTIPLALALPPEALSRDLIVAMSAGVVLFTLLFQGLTLPPHLRRLGLVAEPVRSTSDEYGR